jgi:hypothetical protein
MQTLPIRAWNPQDACRSAVIRPRIEASAGPSIMRARISKEARDGCATFLSRRRANGIPH